MCMHAERIAKAITANHEAEILAAQELCGHYKVIFDAGAMVRKTAELRSDEVAVICKGQILDVDQVIPNYNGQFRTRMHIRGQLLKVQWPLPETTHSPQPKRRMSITQAISNANSPKRPQKSVRKKGPQLTKEVPVAGWVTLKSDESIFLERVTDPAKLPKLEPEPEPELENEHEQAEEDSPTRTHDAARSTTPSFESQGKQRDLRIAELRRASISHKDKALPAGWLAATSRSTGLPYYFNSVSEQISGPAVLSLLTLRH